MFPAAKNRDSNYSAYGDITTTVVLLVILLLGAVNAAWHFSGYYASDDMTYLGVVRGLVENGSFTPSFGGARLSVTALPTLIYAISDSLGLAIGIGTLYVPVLCLIGFFLGRYLSGRVVGLAAALFIATNPLVFIFAGALLPDLIQSIWIGLWMFVVCVVFKHKDRVKEDSKFAALIFCAMGLLTGLAYTAKINGLMAAVPSGLIGIYLARHIWNQKILIYGLSYCAGLVSIFVAETVFFYAFSAGDYEGLGLFKRLDNLSGQSGLLKSRLELVGAYPWERIDYALSVLGWMKGYVYVGLVAFVVIPILNPSLIPIWLCTLWLLSFQILGSTSLVTYLPPVIVDRYFLNFVLPFSIFLAAGLWSFSSRVLGWFDLLRSKSGAAESIVRFCSFGLAAFAFLLLGFQTLAGIYEYTNKTQKVFWGGAVVRNFLRAHDYAVKEYPQYPVVFSDFPSRRLIQLFGSFSPTGLSYWNAPLPSPPFLLIRPVSPSFGDRSVSQLKDRLESSKFVRSTLSTFYPVGRQGYDLRGRLADYFLLPPQEMKSDSASKILSSHLPQGVVAVDLVSSASVKGYAKDAGAVLFDSAKTPIPYFSRSANMVVVSTGGKNVARIPVGSKGSFLIEAFDRSSFTYPPMRGPGHILKRNGQFEFKLQLSSPQESIRARVNLILFNGKTVILNTTSNFHALRRDPVTISVSEGVEKKIDSFRFVIELENNDPSRFHGVEIRDATLSSIGEN